LQAEPAESETALSFSGLGDLLDAVLDEALAPLAAGQRSALARALVLEEVEVPAPDPHAAGVALLNALRALASTRDLLVAVDDVQWLDAASSAALAYAVRRLRGEHVGVLLARRAGLESSLLDDLRRSAGAGRYGDIDVGPLDPAATHQVVHAHLGVALPRPLLAEVHQASGGNPFYTLEIVRTLTRSGVTVEAGRPLPVPASLHDLVHGRLLALSPECRDFLVAAAAHAHPTIEITETASGVAHGVGLLPALDAGIVETDGDRIRFTHPLLAAGALETADPQRRVEIHARLAEVLEDPEARAWQLAASVDEPDEAVATVIENAADHARRRGAPRPAALLLDCARDLTPADQPDRAVRRAVEAAYLHYEAGDSTRAEAQLRAVIAGLALGRERASALTRLARVRAYEALPEAAELFLQAVAEAEGDTEILAAAHLGVADCFWYGMENLEAALEHAQLAAALALDLGDEGLASEALGNQWTVKILLGHADAEAAGSKALAYQRAAAGRRVLTQPRFISASDSLWLTGELEQARAELHQLVQISSELGDESSTPLALYHLGHVENELGQLASALGRARDGQEASVQSGQHTSYAFNLSLESLVEARLGREEGARSVARRALELVPTTGGRRTELFARSALGHLSLATGACDEAVASLQPLRVFVHEESIVEPCVIPFVVDHVEALIELGRRDEAVELLDWYEGNARRLERVSAVANCARCRGLLASQAGDLDGALAAYKEALAWHAKVELPLDRGRTLLALGAAQRRAKRRREARETLDEAVALFERIGAALWAERARAELKRISGRAATPGALTPAEERVAALVTEGKTNREVAAALFLSDRTVEGHLSRVFGKLGIKHRAELGPALASRQTQGVDASNTGDSPVSAEPVAP
jgi:DNA-binding CsgD family transcriptional regulator